MPRAIWKGDLTLDVPGGKAIHVPVKLYSAIEDRDVHFHLLHKTDGVRVKQRMVDPESGEEVAAGRVQHGYPVAGGMVRLSAHDLAGDEPKASRIISVSSFVPAAADRSGLVCPVRYFLGPDGPSGTHAGYAALVAALEESGRRGIAHWVMRKSRQRGALEARAGRLVLITLHPAEGVVPSSALQRPAGPAVNAGEQKLAEQLISTLDAVFDPKAFPDEHRERVEKLIALEQGAREDFST